MKSQTVVSKLDFALLSQQTLLVPSENLCTNSLYYIQYIFAELVS